MLFKLFSKNKKLTMFTALTLSTVMLASCAGVDTGTYNAGKQAERALEVVNEKPEKLVALDVEDNEKERQVVEKAIYDFYYALVDYKPTTMEEKHLLEPREIDNENKYHEMREFINNNIDQDKHITADKNKSMEQKIAELDNVTKVDLVDLAEDHIPEKISFNFNTLNASQKAFVGVVLGNIHLYNVINYDDIAAEKVIDSIDHEKIIFRDHDVIVPRNAVHFANQDLAQEKFFNIPIRLVKTKKNGYSVDFYTYATMLEKFNNSLDEVKDLYEEQSPRLVDEVMKENKDKNYKAPIQTGALW